MSKTYRRNDSRRPKWDKHGNRKSRKQREMDVEVHKHRPKILPSSIDDLDEGFEEKDI